MEKETKKPWERPWTTDEIRAQSANWNLAGDAGLLNHLQEFSQNLLSKTHATEVALDKLMEDMKTTSINVQNVTNKFLSLANTQFVENRVYDDDEKETPVEEKREDLKSTKSKEEKENEAFENVKQALQLGMSFLDTYFETVEVPASDSEEEESSVNMSRLILKPRNPYISRPLPYLIGSQEFMEDENVGLGDLFSDTEENPDQNIVHSSESDEDIVPHNLIVSSKQQISSSSDLENSEPESDRSESMVKQRRTKQSSSVGIVGQHVDEERDMFGQESPPEADVITGGIRSSFSDELASKLGVNKPLISPQNADNLFAPTSETEDDDGLFGKSSHPYSERKGLFDDINNWQNTSDSLWNNTRNSKDFTDSDSSKQLRKDVLFGPDDIEDENNDIFTPSNPIDDKQSAMSPHQVTASTPKDETGVPKRNDSIKHSVTEDLLNKKIKDTTSSLFDKDDLEDDLFATPAVTSVSRQSPADLDSTKRKKLPGAVRVIDDVNLFGNISPVIQMGSSVVDRSNFTERSVSQQEVSSGIGRTVAPKDAEKESLERVENGNEKSLTFDSSLFQATSTKVDNEVLSKSLFNEEHQSDSLFDKPRNQDLLRPNISGNVSGSKLFPNLKTKAKKAVSLFEDSDSGDDELLFSSTSSTSSRSRRSQGSGDLLSNVGEKALFKKGLFDDGFLESESKEEPDVDIFKPFSETNSQNESLKKKSIEEKKDVLGVSSKIGSSIFDDIDDDEDDIFAVPKSKGDSFVKKNNFLHEKSLLFTDEPTNVNRQHNLSNHSVLSSGMSGVGNDFPEGNAKENSDHVKPSEMQSPSLRDTFNTTEVLEKAIGTKLLENDSQVKSAPSSNEQHPSDAIAEYSKVKSSVEVRKANNPVLNIKAEPPRSLNIRKTTNITEISSSNDDEDDDLFENSTTHKSSLENVPSDNVITTSSSFGKLLEGVRSTSGNNTTENAETLEEERNRIPDNQSNSQNAANIPVEVPSPATSSRSQSTSPKKLLIDPRALLPGAKPPPLTVNSDTGVGFDKPAVISSILHSAGKERVKIQAKRRPPTRKARQEALKAAFDESNCLNSSISSHIARENSDFEDQFSSSNIDNAFKNTISDRPTVAEKGQEDNRVDVNSVISIIAEDSSEPSQVTGNSDDYRNISDGVSASSNPMSPLTDEEDLFAVPHEFPGDEVNSKEIASSPKNLFGGAPVLSPFNDLLESGREDSTISPFINVGQVDFLTEELGSKSATICDQIIGAESYPNSLESPRTSSKKETTSASNKSVENTSLFQTSIGSKMFARDLEPEDGLFEKDSRGKSFNENYNDDDDDSLFSSVKKNELRSGSEQEKSMKTKMKVEPGGLFSSLDSPTKSLFSFVSDPSKNSEASKPSREGNFSDPVQKLPLPNDTITDNLYKQGGSISQRQDNDDLFSQGGKVKITGDSSSSASLEKTKSHVTSLFGDDSTDTDDLFSSSSLTAGKKYVASSNSSMLPDSKVKGATDSLFDDCDDDIFAIGLSKPRGNGASLVPEVNKPDHKETDQYLLPKKNSSTKPQIPKQAVQKMTPKDDSFEDPLMVIKK